MPVIADFILLPKGALKGLGEAALADETYWHYLRANGRIAAQYGWSGYVFATLLAYLDDRHRIKLYSSEYEELANRLSKARGLLHFFLTYKLKRAYLAQLDPKAFSETELRDYFNQLNAANDATIGRAMLDGIAAFHQSLEQVDENSVVLVSID